MGFLSSLAGPLIGGASTLLGGILQNNSAKSQAQNQMAFQEDMSNTSYQRQVSDMKAAGLNPILSAKMGGASTPSGSAAPVENVVGPAVNSAIATRQAQATLEQIHAQTDKLKVETDAIKQGLPGRLIGPQNIETLKGLVTPLVGEEPLNSPERYQRFKDNLKRDFGDESLFSPERFQRFKSRLSDDVNRLLGSGFIGNSAKSYDSNSKEYWGGFMPPRVNQK
ncbi:MAG: DNA pilot protein [Microvirus sp.]|nr:MAG: DNA pilot protein [Microvirus sp.]